MKFEHTETWGFEHALRGMRNPLESWDKSDSGLCKDIDCNNCSRDRFSRAECGKVRRNDFVIGKNDLKLAQKLIKAGSEHRKFLRQIFVSVDITAPAYFMAELDTYKIGVTRNSTSFQHKGTSKHFTIDAFEVDDENKELFEHCWYWEQILDTLNTLRDKYLETKDYKYFRLIRQLLPQSYLYRSTVTMSYENVLKMIRERRGHKLTEWSKSFIKWAESLPYAKELLFYDDAE